MPYRPPPEPPVDVPWDRHMPRVLILPDDENTSSSVTVDCKVRNSPAPSPAPNISTRRIQFAPQALPTMRPALRFPVLHRGASAALSCSSTNTGSVQRNACARHLSTCSQQSILQSVALDRTPVAGCLRSTGRSFKFDRRRGGRCSTAVANRVCIFFKSEYDPIVDDTGAQCKCPPGADSGCTGMFGNRGRAH
eukprot:SAG31_NODE_7409_length_1696_cov_1.757671_2_plen_193_part_00